MRIFFVSFLLLFLFFTAQIYAAPEIDSVKIGWGKEGYYRLGYLAPAQIRLKSDDDFEGLIMLRIGCLSYSKFFQITKNSIADIRFNILILSPTCDKEVGIWKSKGNCILCNSGSFDGINKFINSGAVVSYWEEMRSSNISKDEFLIAVEKSYLTIFRDEFTQRYPDAAKKTKFISFQTDELPQTAQSYESLDLVVLSSANLPPSIQNALYNWSNNMDGIVLYKLGDIGNISQLFKNKKNPYLENPCINSDIYGKVSHQLIPPSAKKTLSDYILIYSIITVIIFFLLLLLKNTKKMVGTIFTVISIAIFLFYTFYLPHNPIVEMNDFGQTNELFMRILDYSAKNDIVLERSKEEAFIIKPIYRDIKSMINTKIHYHSGKELKDTIKIEFPNNLQDKTFIFQVYTVRK